jgi:hypothetical protein
VDTGAASCRANRRVSLEDTDSPWSVSLCCRKGCMKGGLDSLRKGWLSVRDAW